jgi:hypothetical protein
MSFIPAYLAAGIDQPDFDLRVIPIFQFPDEHRCLEWFRKAQEARRVGQSLVRSGLILGVEQRRGIVAAVTGQPAPSAKRSVGIDTSHYRVPGFLLVRTVASAPAKGSLNDAIRIASESRPKMSKETIERLWRDHKPIAHFGAALWWWSSLRRREFLNRNPRAALEWAESLRLKGEQYRSPHAPAGPLLDPAQTVKMPPDLGLCTVPLALPPAEEITI